jgi:dTDP-glucose pyrophosphorylase
MLDKDIWKRALLTGAATIQEAIRNLERTALRIILVVDGDGRLIGTISDGDIRRGLLKDVSLNASVDSVVHRSPLVVPSQLGLDTVRQLMVINKVHQIPIVDEERRLIGLHVWDELQAPAERENLLIIMAGGKGTRLRPYTKNCPKPLIQVAGKPMMEHIIERSKLAGFNRFVISINYLGEMIENYFGDGRRWNVDIRYLREDSPLGTAGALSLLQPAPELPFIVTNGDVLTDIHYDELLDFHVLHEATATMAVRMHEWQHPFGVVQTQGIDIVGFDEKPVARTYINAGVYALNPQALAYMKKGRCDMPGLFERLQLQGCRTVAYAMHEPWLDVGRPADLNQAEAEAANTVRLTS